MKARSWAAARENDILAVFIDLGSAAALASNPSNLRSESLLDLYF